MSPSPELLPTAIQMILALVAILGGIGLLVLLSRRLMGRAAGRSRDAAIRVLASSPIAVKKTISLVQVPGAILVLGLTSDQMVLLGKVEDPALCERLRGDAGSDSGIPFAEHLRRLSPWTNRGGSKEPSSARREGV